MSERIVALIPIRSWGNGKTRLSPILAPETREQLLRRIAERVVRAANESQCFESVIVVSSEQEVLAWAAAQDGSIRPLPQPGHLPGLNGAISAGREWALGVGADAVVSIFADLPLICPADIRDFVARQEAVVLGPDRRSEGTNALLLRLAGRGREFELSFGEDSLSRHLAEAHRLGMSTALHEASGIGFDLDTPDDWTDFLDTNLDDEGLTAIRSHACGAGVG